MLFSAQVFTLLFLPAALGGYYALGGSRAWRQTWVIAASVFFYGWWDWRYVPLLAALTLATWGIARAFLATGRRWVPLAGVALNLGALGLFKYADFLRGTAFGLLGMTWRPWALVLPLGISFFAFQKVSYLIDLRRGDRHGYGLRDFAMFVSFFPQLIAGPLVRHNEIIPQFERDPRGPDVWENLARGFVLFVIGLAKKIAIADTLAPLADGGFDAAARGGPSAGVAWIAVAAYTLQIYFDFSGYSDMAIGIARAFGLRLPVNFDAPYRAVSIRDFWRRWHITLSRFLRDYLYIPLGGNRVSSPRQAANVVATMLLGGLWHGASWTFVAWGGLHGAALALAHVWQSAGIRLPRLVGWVLTLAFVAGCWVLFRAPTFTAAAHMFAALFGGGARVPVEPPADREHLATLAAAGAIALLAPTSQRIAASLRPEPILAVPVGAAFAYLVLLGGGRLQNAFIYFQF